jgi:hypothetical protein
MIAAYLQITQAPIGYCGTLAHAFAGQAAQFGDAGEVSAGGFSAQQKRDTLVPLVLSKNLR